MKQNFMACESEAEGSLRRALGKGLATPNQTDLGHPAARRPTGISARELGGSVRYQQSGLTATAVKPFRWTARRGNPGGFLVQYQGEALNLGPSLVAGPAGS